MEIVEIGGFSATIKILRISDRYQSSAGAN